MKKNKLLTSAVLISSLLGYGYTPLTAYALNVELQPTIIVSNNIQKLQNNSEIQEHQADSDQQNLNVVQEASGNLSCISSNQQTLENTAISDTDVAANENKEISKDNKEGREVEEGESEQSPADTAKSGANQAEELPKDLSKAQQNAEANAGNQTPFSISVEEIGKGESFNEKLYLRYIEERITAAIQKGIDTGNQKNPPTPIESAKESLMLTLVGILFMDSTTYQVDKSVIQQLVATYILYDIAFPKDSGLYLLLGGTNDGTTPETNTGFYPGTQLLTGTAINNQNGQMMQLQAYYVDQNSDKTIMIHGGFRGNWSNGLVTDEYNDFYQAGYNLLFVDPRATGGSGGDYVTYGQYESDDVLYWINQEVQKRPQQNILLYGGSMGAATMMSTLAKDIPANVKGIIANCGFKSIDEQLRFTYSNMLAPVLSDFNIGIVADKEHEDLYMELLKKYYLDQEVNLDTLVDLPIKGMQKNLPKLIIHGDQDDVVPVSNAYDLYEIANGYKKLLIVPGAGHGSALETAPVSYKESINNFLQTIFQASVHVKHQDQQGKNLLTDSEFLVKSGVYGDTYQTEQQTFANYELDYVEGEESGVYNENTTTVTYVYRKVQSTLTIEYRDEATNKLLDLKKVTGEIGQQYSLKAKEYWQPVIGEYTLDSEHLPDTLTGSIGEKPATITFYYQKNKEDVVEAATKPSEVAGNDPDKIASDKKLPATGEKNQQVFLLVGFSMVIGAGMLLLLKKARKN